MQIYVLNDVRMHAYYSLSALVFVLVHQCPVYLSHSANYFCPFLPGLMESSHPTKVVGEIL